MRRTDSPPAYRQTDNLLYIGSVVLSVQKSGQPDKQDLSNKSAQRGFLHTLNRIKFRIRALSMPNCKTEFGQTGQKAPIYIDCPCLSVLSAVQIFYKCLLVPYL